ncbi:glycosyltransferase family 1 protein [Pseudarthrobacter sp. J64]|uniref:glycosyltransferase family 4 protein n=1 Tax=Pseudarthrobacter sp. J64 TaxID=3116485 RepID=UPI002E81B5E4|nr:glycosyltransferase family 1 protein [Pseudarthrobacter sp. J64]MEE2567935.1 glycosyltransferase family 1 protein [Pseudarthrobacter sp. J64]
MSGDGPVGKRFVFDGYWWVAGPPSGHNVLREMVLAWKRNFPQDDIHIVLKGRVHHSLDLLRGVTYHGSLIPIHPWTAFVTTSLYARRIDADAAVTQNFASVGRRSHTFVHDVLFQSNPEYFTFKERMYLALIPVFLRFGGPIFTTSISESRRIAKFNPKAGPVTAVGLGASSKLISAVPARPAGITASRFLLSVGRLNDRKNLATTLEAAAQSRSVTARQPLIVVGEPDGVHGPLTESVRASVNRREIIFLGFLSDEELSWCYANANALYFLSLDEGFGLPPLEALSFNCPVVVSDIPVFREVYTGCVRFIAANDVDAVQEHMSVMLQSPRSSSSNLDPAISDLMKRYSWDRMVQNMRERMI